VCSLAKTEEAGERCLVKETTNVGLLCQVESPNFTILLQNGYVQESSP
jgi:hypothetical protein